MNYAVNNLDFGLDVEDYLIGELLLLFQMYTFCEVMALLITDDDAV